MDNIKLNRRHAYKTVFHFSVIFLFIFSVYLSLEFTQSSVNLDIGTTSLSLLYFTFALSSILIAPALVVKLSPKWSLFLALFGHTLYIVANFHPTWITMMISSGILGVSSAIIWVAQASYITYVALDFTNKTSVSIEAILPKLHGLFWFVFNWSIPVGNLVAALVLGKTGASSENQHETWMYNTTENILQDSLFNSTKEEYFCGQHYCPYLQEHQETIVQPEKKLIYILLSIFLGFNIFGIVLCSCVESIGPPEKETMSIKKEILSTFKLTFDAKFWLIVPSAIYEGILHATISAAFTQALVACPFGVAAVGYTMMAHGLSMVVASFMFGHFTKRLPRKVFFPLGILCVIAETLFWCNWTPREDELWLVIVTLSLCGIAFSSFKVHFYSIVSTIFTNNSEAAFGYMNLWKSLGSVAVFFYNQHLCFKVKSYIVIAVAILVISTYPAMECCLHRSAKNEKHPSGPETENTLISGIPKEIEDKNEKLLMEEKL